MIAAMDFFTGQENARQHTLHLVLLFLAAVVDCPLPPLLESHSVE